MSENGERKRPNENYKLSNETINPDEIVYHYNREHRLAKAPQSVQDLYKPESRRRFGIFRSLTGSKPRAMLFYSIIVMCIMILILSRLNIIGTTYNLDGNELTVQAVYHEGTVIIEITKSVLRSVLDYFTPAYTGAVTIAVLPFRDVHPENTFYHRIFFTNEEVEVYRFAVPFDAVELVIAFDTERSSLNIRVQAE